MSVVKYTACDDAIRRYIVRPGTAPDDYDHPRQIEIVTGQYQSGETEHFNQRPYFVEVVVNDLDQYCGVTTALSYTIPNKWLQNISLSSTSDGKAPYAIEFLVRESGCASMDHEAFMDNLLKRMVRTEIISRADSIVIRKNEKQYALPSVEQIMAMD